MKTSFLDYEELVKQTKEPNCNDIQYLALAMCGHAGEIAKYVKDSIHLDPNGVMAGMTRTAIAAEIGMVLQYITELAVELQEPLWSIAKCNMESIKHKKDMEAKYGIDGNQAK